MMRPYIRQKNCAKTDKRASVLRIWIFEWKNTNWIMMVLNEMLLKRLIPGLAASKMPHVRQSHAIKYVLYYGVW